MNTTKALIICVYSFLVILFCEIGFVIGSLTTDKFDILIYKIIPIIFLIWLMIFICFSVLNILYTKKLYKQNKLFELRKNVKYIKLYLIPYWIINFAVSVFVLLLIMAATKGLGIILFPVFIFFAYILLLITSSVSITYIVLLNKNKHLKHYYVHIILQLCFVLDIIGAIYLLKKINIEI